VVRIDNRLDKTHLTGMNAVTKLSSKGQVVLPKNVRDALGWPEGQTLTVRRAGGGVLLIPPEPKRETISWEEFRRRVPKHDGPAISIEEMNMAVNQMFAERHKRGS
jgi:AbrB family looped-hinge helix DNA binding protein